MFLSSPNACFAPPLQLQDGAASSGLQVARGTKVATAGAQSYEREIRDMFRKLELSVSSYDTAWVAMVPSPGFLQQPCFPQCLNWLLENQLHDGSWSLPHQDHLLMKDSMMSTLACVLALSRWEIGEKYISKGIEFMRSNFGAIMDDKQLLPIGFDIIFPTMMESAQDLGLNFSFSTKATDTLLHRRDLELERLAACNSPRSKAYLAYVYEGLPTTYDGSNIVKYQNKNGSILNSPSSTAGFLIQNNDAKCLEYVCSVVKLFGNAVPTIYPIHAYIRLCMVDQLERLGISRHFQKEIKDVLDETYRCWMQGDEELFMDKETYGLAFRLLRTNGYEISSDVFGEFNKEEYLFGSKHKTVKDIRTVLELYRASEIMTSPDEQVLEALHSWTSCLLRQELLNGTIHDENCLKDVDLALKFPYEAYVERLENRRNIQCYDVDDIRLLKASYRCSNVNNEVFLTFAVKDYNFCQVIHQKELENLERWVKETRLDQLTFARQKLTYIHFSVTSILSPPELSDARMSWTKNVFLVTVIDDFFDVEGSKEELANLIELVDRWDIRITSNYCSDRVEIIYNALHKTINEIGAIASTRQGQDVMGHLVDLWLALLKAEMQEFEWAKEMSVPTVDEYIETASYSFALGPIVLITLYFLGHKLSKEVISSPEYNNLYKHMSICCRLLNDCKTFKAVWQREGEEGKLNCVLLYKIHAPVAVTEEEAVTEVERIIDQNKRDLLSLVLQTKGSIVPKSCKDLFWNTVRITRLFYRKTDGFTSPVEMMSAVNEVIHEPINFP